MKCLHREVKQTSSACSITLSAIPDLDLIELSV